MAADAVVLAATIILVALCLLFGFSNGFHDAANAVATVIATKSLTPRQAVYSSAVFNFLPCLVQSTAVASTIAKIVSTSCIASNAASLDMNISDHILPLPMIAAQLPSNTKTVFAALIAAIIWNFFTWSVSMPSSSSHALIGGLVGAALGLFGVSCVNWKSVISVVEAIVLSPVVAISVAFITMRLLSVIMKAAHVLPDHQFFRYTQIASSLAVSWGHVLPFIPSNGLKYDRNTRSITRTAGANDAQKTAGIILAVLAASGNISSDTSTPEQCATKLRGDAHVRSNPLLMYAVPLWVLLSSNVIIAAGTVYGGWGIIETMGVGITTLTRGSGFAANVGAVTAIFGATQLGIPISTTHAAAASIAGAGFADKRPVKLQVMKDMATAWVLTLPAAALIAYMLVKFAAFTHPIVAYVCSASSVAGLLVWARFVMADAKGRHEVEAAVQEQNTVQELGEMPDIRLLPAAARSEQVDEEE